MKNLRNILCSVALLATSMIHGSKPESEYTVQLDHLSNISALIFPPEKRAQESGLDYIMRVEAALEILKIVAQHNSFFAAFLARIPFIPVFLVAPQIILMAYLAIIQIQLSGEELSDELQYLYDILVYGHANCP
jgi:hypothetical protein